MNIKKRKAQGLVEYALIIVLIAVVAIVSLRVVGPFISQIFTDDIGNTLVGLEDNTDDGNSNVEETQVPPTETPSPSIITGGAARAQYCADRDGWVGGVNWGSITHTFLSGGQTYQVTGAWSCPIS